MYPTGVRLQPLHVPYSQSRNLPKWGEKQLRSVGTDGRVRQVR